MVNTLCSAGQDPSTCCVGTPWMNHKGMEWEPLPQAAIDIAAELGLDPHDLDYHAEAIHGAEPHDRDYAEAVRLAAACLGRSGSRFECVPS